MIISECHRISYTMNDASGWAIPYRCKRGQPQRDEDVGGEQEKHDGKLSMEPNEMPGD
jgi:hypothetical protein